MKVAMSGITECRNFFGFLSMVRQRRRFFPARLLVGVFAGMSLICFGLVPIAAAGDLGQPFYSRNLNPFVQIFGLPAVEGAKLTPEGRTEARLVFDVANNFTSDIVQGEHIEIKGETYRSVVALRYGLGKNLEVGIDLPHVYHGRGHLNDFIIDFHDTFGLPQGGRDTAPNDDLAYVYIDNGNNLVSVAGSASGIGDVLLSAAMPLWKDGGDSRRLALRAALKVPTGSASNLLGSGSTDFSLRLSGEDRQTFANARITGFGTLGALVMTEGDVIPDRQRHIVGFGTVGLGWQPLSWLALKLQLDGNTAFYNSELYQLDYFSTQLILGGTIGFTENLLLDIAISEDISIDAAPDVTFNISLRGLF